MASLGALALLTAPLAFAEGQQGEEFLRGVAAVDDGDAARLEAVAGALTALPDSLDGFFAIASTGKVFGQAPTDAQLDLLLVVEARFDGRKVLAYVREHLDGEANHGWRRVALRLLGLHASPSDFSLIADVVLIDRGAQTIREPLLEPTREAVVGVGTRHGFHAKEVGWLASEAEPLRGVLIRATGQIGDPQGLPWLGAHLDDPDHGAAALQEIGRLAPKAPSGLAAQSSRAIRPLLKSEDASTRKQAVRCLGSLGDPDSVPFLVRLLEQAPGDGERRMAANALRDISGVQLPDQPQAWKSWHAAEVEWMNTQGVQALELLESENDGDVVAALQDLSSHSLHRRRLAPELIPLLESHPSPTVRVQVCLALARLRPAQAKPALQEALDDPDPEVSRNAAVALESIGS